MTEKEAKKAAEGRKSATLTLITHRPRTPCHHRRRHRATRKDCPLTGQHCALGSLCSPCRATLTAYARPFPRHILLYQQWKRGRRECRQGLEKLQQPTWYRCHARIVPWTNIRHLGHDHLQNCLQCRFRNVDCRYLPHAVPLRISASHACRHTNRRPDKARAFPLVVALQAADPGKRGFVHHS
jgi:hypothetical protein